MWLCLCTQGVLLQTAFQSGRWSLHHLAHNHGTHMTMHIHHAQSICCVIDTTASLASTRCNRREMLQIMLPDCLHTACRSSPSRVQDGPCTHMLHMYYSNWRDASHRCTRACNYLHGKYTGEWRQPPTTSGLPSLNQLRKKIQTMFAWSTIPFCHLANYYSTLSSYSSAHGQLQPHSIHSSSPCSDKQTHSTTLVGTIVPIFKHKSLPYSTNTQDCVYRIDVWVCAQCQHEVRL